MKIGDDADLERDGCGLADLRRDEWQPECGVSGSGRGAQSAVTLCLSMAGMLCLWNGVLEVMNRSGLTAVLRRLLRPVLRRIYPAFQDNAPVMDAVSANVCANLLGLGNAATPFGLRAARGMAEHSGGVANDSLCLLVVCNTASIQLLPTTVAALRAGGRVRLALRYPAGRVGHLCRRADGRTGGGGSSAAGVAVTALLVPLLLAAVAVCGVIRRVDVCAALADGARSGGKILLSVFPNLVALLTAVAMLRASGAFEALAAALGPVLGRLGIPAETLPLMLVRPFSGSAALGGGGQSSFRPMARTRRSDGRRRSCWGNGDDVLHRGSLLRRGGVRRSRYALPAALTADFVGFLAAALAVRLFF